MPNSTITTVNIGKVILKSAEFRDELLVFAGAATVVSGTLLARKAVADAVTASAFTGTGNGTLTLATVAAGQIVPIPGIYVLNVITAVTNGGVLELVDPNGALVASNLMMTVGAGATTVFGVDGLEFSVTDGSEVFAIDYIRAREVAA